MPFSSTSTAPQLQCHAHSERTIVRRVTQRVAAGELVVIVGPNGAGKTTLLRTQADGLLAPSAGLGASVRQGPCRDRTPRDRAHDLDLARFGRVMWLVADGVIAAASAPREVLAAPATRAAFQLEIHIGELPSGALFAVPAEPVGNTGRR